MKTEGGETLINAPERFIEREACLAVVALIVGEFSGPVIDLETKQLLVLANGEWVNGQDFFPFPLEEPHLYSQTRGDTAVDGEQ